MELFPPRPTLRLTRRFWASGAIALILANAVVLNQPNLTRWVGGPYKPVTSPVDDAPEPRELSIGADPRPRPPVSPGSNPLHLAVMLVAVNTLVVSAFAFAVLGRYLEDLRRYRLCLPTGFDEHRLRSRHCGAPGLDLSRVGGSRFGRFDFDDDDDELYDEP